MKKTTKFLPDKDIFKDRNKEAKFWEEHFDEAWKAGTSAKVKFAKNLSSAINIRLDPKALEIVREQAQKKGLGPTQLIRMWVMERINSI